MNGKAATGGGSRVPSTPEIPAGVRKTVDNIKEIAANHTDEEVYAMLRECGMDPNETAQKLLLQDTFHEVKRKHNKKKEGGNKESFDPNLKMAGPQGMSRRWGTGRFSSRFINAKEARNATPILNDKTTEKGKAPLEPVSPNKETKASTSTLSPKQTDSPIIKDHSTKITSADLKADEPAPPPPSDSTTHNNDNNNNNNKPKAKSKAPPSDKKSNNPVPAPVQGSGILAKPPESGVCSTVADPVPVPTLEVRSPRGAGTIRRPVRNSGSFNKEISQGGAPSSSHPRPSNSRPSSGSRPSSSSYNNRAPNGQQRGGQKEWKPKSTSVPPSQPQPPESNPTPPTPDNNKSSDPEPVARSIPAPDPVARSIPAPDPVAVVKLVETKPEKPVVLEREHVIIPNHLQVPDAEKYGLSFGSFDQIISIAVPTIKKDSEPVEPTTIHVEDPKQSPITQVEETFVVEAASNVEETVLGQQSKEKDDQPGVDFSIINSSFNQVNQVNVANQSPPLDVTEMAQVQTQDGTASQLPNMMVNHVLNGNQSRQSDQAEAVQTQVNDASRQPNVIMVQQQLDLLPSSYYSQMYRSTDSDNRFSPFLQPGGSIKYGNISVMTGQNGQIAPEAMLSSTGTPVIPQTSLSIPQQTLPVFRHTVGAVQLSHYAPNYLPYNQYMPPFYVHPSLAFPQQTPAGGVYGAGTTGMTGTLPGQQHGRYNSTAAGQYKTGTTGGMNVGPGSVYGPYGLGAMGGYTGVNSGMVSANPGESDDLGGSQFKDNNLYLSGQAGRADLSNLGSFYGLTPQVSTTGQHMGFAPTGPIGPNGQGPSMGPPFSGIYPPQHHHLLHQALPTHSVEMGGVNNGAAGPNGNLYPPSGAQRNPVTWAGSY